MRGGEFTLHFVFLQNICMQTQIIESLLSNVYHKSCLPFKIQNDYFLSFLRGSKRSTAKKKERTQKDMETNYKNACS